MPKPTIEQIKNRELIPSDTINLEWDNFLGKVSSYILETKGLVWQILEINTKKWWVLSPFLYKKPIGEDVLNPEENWETKEREWYYPLEIIKGAYRGPNHWHRKDDAISCAVKINDVWETRYFPKQNIFKETWDEAVRIIDKNNNSTSSNYSK